MSKKDQPSGIVVLATIILGGIILLICWIGKQLR